VGPTAEGRRRWVQQWLQGVETEEEWREMLERLYEWEKEVEKEEGMSGPTEEVSKGFVR